MGVIDENGKFEFSDLPRNSHVELISVCDGWLSKAKTEDLADYDQIHQTEFGKLNENPGGGSSSLGAGGQSLDLRHNQQTRAFGPSTKRLSKYFRTTGPDGRTVIANFPPGYDLFHVLYPGYDMPGDPRLDYGVPMGVAEVESGVTSKITIRMTPDRNYGYSIRTGRPNDDGIVPLHVSFVDNEGAPLDRVRVNFSGYSILQSGTRQTWPAEWSTELNSGELTYDEAGMVTFRVRLPEIKNPDNSAQYSIWFDAECPGFAPLKDHEYSLTKPLPIRMTAK